jgi:hypothetical protein
MPADNQRAPETLVRTFADRAGECRCTAIGVSPSDTTAWRIGVFCIGDNGEDDEDELTSADTFPVPHGRRPSFDDLSAAIDQFLGDRLCTLVETSPLAAQISQLLAVSGGAVGHLTHDRRLEAADMLSHASQAARVLTMGEPSEVATVASALIQIAFGEHPEPPRGWLKTPLGKIVADAGLVEASTSFGEPISASVAAELLGEDGRDAIVELIDAGLLRAHPRWGVDTSSVIDLVLERRRELGTSEPWPPEGDG